MDDGSRMRWPHPGWMGLLLPNSFYEDFPVDGAAWVSTLVVLGVQDGVVTAVRAILNPENLARVDPAG